MSDSSSLENEAGPGESAEARRGGDMGSPGVGVMLPTEELLSPFSKLEENVVNDDTISTIFYLSDWSLLMVMMTLLSLLLITPLALSFGELFVLLQ